MNNKVLSKKEVCWWIIFSISTYIAGICAFHAPDYYNTLNESILYNIGAWGGFFLSLFSLYKTYKIVDDEANEEREYFRNYFNKK